MDHQEKKRILITGATGLIGSRLTELLLENGYAVRHLGRTRRNGKIESYVWDVKNQAMDLNALTDTDAVIHLAGAGIADERWTDARKKEILDSRVNSTRLLFKGLQNAPSVKTVISASAIGYYGFADNEKLYRENHEAGNDFLATVTRQWEDEVKKIESLSIRTVLIRIGIVLSEKGGALEPIAKTVRLYAGAALGNGSQHISWIHIDDLCRMFIHALEHEALHGPYNGVGPYPVTNRELTQAVARTLGKPMFLPNVPPFVLKLMFGEMANIVLAGNRVSSEKIEQTGFRFKFNSLEKALDDLLK